MDEDIERMWRDRTLYGRRVQRNGEDAVVIAYLTGFGFDGGVQVNRPIEGFTYWNVDELTLVPATEEARRG